MKPKKDDRKNKILIISTVKPFPGESGQQMRVRHTIEAIKPFYHITFLTTTTPDEINLTKNKLNDFVDESIVLQTRYFGPLKKIFFLIYGRIWSVLKGLRFSNYVVEKLDFTNRRLRRIFDKKDFDIVLYEYWHAYKTVEYFKKSGIPTVLDTHNILWKSYDNILSSSKFLPLKIKDWRIKKYKSFEENAWNKFDALIAINHNEFNYIKNVVKKNRVFYVPMGIKMGKWNQKRSIQSPPRVGYFGGLRSIHNQKDAMLCYEKIMPHIWSKIPATELWIIGSNPPDDIKLLSKKDNRLKITGYVKDVENILRTMTAIVIPWSGTYGFRSRVIEVMALGLPLVTTQDAVNGMGLKNGKGIYICSDLECIVKSLTKLMCNEQKNKISGVEAKNQIVKKYNFENTYGLLPNVMNKILKIA